MMEQTITLLREPPLADTAAPAQKRRKLRKGTQSCWECKRRKARCTFSIDTPDTCDGCKRRGSDCVSQETTDEPPPPAGSNKHIVDRLGHVEALVGQLVKAARQTGSLDLQRTRPWGSREEPSSPESPVDPSGSCDHHSSQSSLSGSVDLHQHSSEKDTSQTSVPSQDDAKNPESHDDLSKGLLKAWPKQKDLDIILGIPVQTSQIIRAVTCTRVDTNGSELPSPKALLQLPPPGSHPTLIARKLLVLATFLQGIPESLAHHLNNLSTSYEEIMSQAVKTVHKLVTSNDELVTSLEGIECILLEALYKNYAGDLRQSWLAARRAITIAQMLGMDRGVTPLSLSGSTIEPEDMWFRLVQFDRYIALMLGLPHTSVRDSFATPEVLENHTALERLLRLCCVACGRILQRSYADMYDPETTKEIDKLLQDASTGMPAQFWVIPTIPSSNEVSKIRETLRFNYHFMHYHLLLQLHLPYLLRPRSEQQYDYNRMTAVTASREMLSRFMSFRTLQAARFYCRGIDLITFLASTALCLAHVCDRSQTKADDNGFHFLAHQRLSDRGILEQVLETMQSISQSKNDTISKRVVGLLQYLLVIEEDAAAGTKQRSLSSRSGHVGNR
ncbi:hypothetical protein CkaCkLH20_11037 [Colletotrichum karsti]|uniref:Zn(2)-C6 fungal-type domain-containing protein n=1 Tax=Colletotrichum karsti TaxID=1095194 RepID=A0A9P6I3R2_9PEZI|nr:uncharacterized protein CkaCkLH20_11037 [Colletotrichum karsti]KAF9871390.1 hypothetical protein CkaCkLH20_11037 [Colletotrichum karsti]